MKAKEMQSISLAKIRGVANYFQQAIPNSGDADALSGTKLSDLAQNLGVTLLVVAAGTTHD